MSDIFYLKKENYSCKKKQNGQGALNVMDEERAVPVSLTTLGAAALTVTAAPAGAGSVEVCSGMTICCSSPSETSAVPTGANL
jgi:hypothetical protein